MQRGVIYGVLAGAIWGFIFLAPRLLPDFSPVLLSAGRYVMYGGVSIMAAASGWRGLAARLTRADLIALVKFALIGNLLYYMLIASAVQLVGTAPVSLIIGIMPVTVTLAGRRDRGAIDLRRLALPLLLVVAGMLCINVDVFSAAAPGSGLSHLAGVACAVGALASWTWYAVVNARYLQAHAHFNGNEWSALWGIVTGALGALMWLAFLCLPSDWLQPGVAPHRWEMFWIVCFALAFGASWVGNMLWNATSRLLPLTLSAQMIVFETLFALLYGFVYDHRTPRSFEVAAIVLLMAGVLLAVRQHAVSKHETIDATPDAAPR